MAATLRDVAERAGVSPATASRVARGVPAVQEGTRLRVLAAIEAVGYRPDSAARSMRTGVSHAVGYVVPDISNWFYSQIFHGAQGPLHEAGYELVLATSNADRDREWQAIDSMLSRRVDGLILSLADEDAAHLSAPLKGLPTVLLDRECEEFDAGVVLSDHRSGIRSAVTYLLDIGHRRIAFLGGKESLYATRARVQAFHAAAEDRPGLDTELVECLGDRSIEMGERRALELLTGPLPPTAIIAGSNQLLHGVLNALNRLDLHCPRDLSLIACEDSDICQVYRPGITVVRRDVRELGAEAARLLLAELGEAEEAAGGCPDPSLPHLNRKLLPTEFVLRESTGPPARNEG